MIIFCFAGYAAGMYKPLYVSHFSIVYSFIVNTIANIIVNIHCQKLSDVQFDFSILSYSSGNKLLPAR